MTDRRTARVVVVEPDPSDPLERFQEWLEAAGIELRTVRPDRDEVPSVADADGVIVLGGPMSSNDNADHPWLEDIRVLLRDAVAREVPVLGICLGAQLLAQAAGGEVTRGENGVEAGLIEVRVRNEASDDDLFGALDRSFTVASMHGDMISELPEGASWLGSSDAYRFQAFRSGSCAWGVQFHPEISPPTYENWVGKFTSDDPEEVRRVEAGIGELRAGDARAAVWSRTLADRFAELVLLRATSGTAV
ncbi:type 1 glutamine amidotransferase [Gordonia McavH-238-E]|uniref:type 1 glutamine amidotransferase n=1 Tax=Gordonia sp. McavH-238-E TaxID=2917736 RepID=UPI001EF4C5F3|nr:type 1 glutamine amidotransferase [Gordonia sp. McavH-238-E]MCG7632928.1 type 1 glutamine amidotransferase [Gordonia sp. McavH-238-E]